MAGSKSGITLEKISIRREGCETIITPCVIEITWEAESEEVELRCGTGINRASNLLGWNVSGSFSQADAELYAMMNGGIVVTNATTGEKTAIVKAGDRAPVVTLVGQGRSLSGEWVYVKFVSLQLYHSGGSWTVGEFPVTEFEGFAQEVALIESPTEVANIVHELYGSFAALHAWHPHGNNTTVLGAVALTGQIESVCNEIDTEPLTQATLNRRPTRLGDVLRFDGVDDQLVSAALVPVSPVTRTIAMTVRITEANASLTTPQAVLIGSATSTQIAVADTFWQISGVATNLVYSHRQDWHRVLYVQNATTHQLYIDGVLIGQVTAASATLSTITIGQNGALATLGMEVGALEIYGAVPANAAEIAYLDYHLCQFLG